jgi:methyl-accepting chemotaxis protein
LDDYQSYRATQRLISDTERVTHAVRVNGGITSLLASLHKTETSQRGYLLTGADRYLEDYKTAAIEVSAHLTELHRLVADPNQKRRLATLEPLIKDRLERLTKGVKIRAEKGLEGAVEFTATGIGSSLMNQIRTVASDLNEGENALLEKRKQASQSSANIALNTILYGIPLAIAAVGVIGFFLTRNITRPLNAATAIAERLANGDVLVAIPSEKRRDEVGLLLRAFESMAGFQRNMAAVAEQIAAGNLRVKVSPLSDKDTLGQAFSSMIANLQRLNADITAAVNVLGSAASEILVSTTQFAAAATETATATTQTTTTVEEVRQTAQLSSKKAQSVADSTQKAAQVSQTGKKSTEESGAGMERIRAQMESIADSMVRLSEQTQAIGQIIAAVDDLAAQSNLLAVNAAIEAAKAGEQGKGFAVVAQEVKSLAEQSKQATNQVRAILHDIQKATSAAVMATEQGNRAVEAGAQQAALAGDSILALANSVAEAAQAATQIAASSQQQLVGVEQVAAAMENIKQSSAQNAASARQLENSARNLNDLGQRLRDLTAKYQDKGRVT